MTNPEQGIEELAHRLKNAGIEYATYDDLVALCRKAAAAISDAQEWIDVMTQRMDAARAETERLETLLEAQKMGEFLRSGNGPEQQALLRLIGTLVDVPPYAERT